MGKIEKTHKSRVQSGLYIFTLDPLICSSLSVLRLSVTNLPVTLVSVTTFSLNFQLSDNKARCERAESDKKQLKFAVKQLNAKIHEYEIMITRLQHAVKNNEVYDMYDETL